MCVCIYNLTCCAYVLNPKSVTFRIAFESRRRFSGYKVHSILNMSLILNLTQKEKKMIPQEMSAYRLRKQIPQEML